MRKVSIICVGIILLITMIGWHVFAKESSFAKKPVNAGNIVCPVMGTKVVPGKSITVEYNGKLYNVCCPVCVKEFKKDPEKYDRIVEEQVKRAQSEEAK